MTEEAKNHEINEHPGSNPRKKKPILLISIGVWFIISLIILGILFMKLTKQNSECMDNPFVYGAKITYKSGLDITCSCIPLDPRQANFYFDKEGMSIEPSSKPVFSNFTFNSSLLITD